MTAEQWLKNIEEEARAAQTAPLRDPLAHAASIRAFFAIATPATILRLVRMLQLSAFPDEIEEAYQQTEPANDATTV